MNSVSMGAFVNELGLIKVAISREYKFEKGAGTPFLEQNRPDKVKEIYNAIKRDHPEMPAGLKARIAASRGKKNADRVSRKTAALVPKGKEEKAQRRRFMKRLGVGATAGSLAGLAWPIAGMYATKSIGIPGWDRTVPLAMAVGAGGGALYHALKEKTGCKEKLAHALDAQWIFHGGGPGYKASLGFRNGKPKTAALRTEEGIPFKTLLKRMAGNMAIYAPAVGLGLGAGHAFNKLVLPKINLTPTKKTLLAAGAGTLAGLAGSLATKKMLERENEPIDNT